MAAKVPFTRSIAWAALVPQLALLFGLSYLFHQFDPDNGILFGALVYLVLSFILKLTITGAHRTGIRAIRKLDFANAIPDFERSYACMQRHPWVDRWRSITVLSASATSYREMALVNIAFCRGQLGDGAQCRALYERALVEFPDSAIAKAALNMLRSVEAVPTA